LKIFISLLLLAVTGIYDSQGQRLSPFLSATLNAEEPGGEQVPFENTISYFDYIDFQSKPDTILEGKSVYYRYFILPSDLTEIGIRLISPVPELFFANRGDIESETFQSLSKEKRTEWFDSAIKIEYLSPETGKNIILDTLRSQNSCSKDVPFLPDGKYGNPQIRLIDPKIPGGIYRVSVIVEKQPKAFSGGSIALQIGTVPGIKGIRISTSKENL
jgi:hypothetical protein